MQFSGPTPAILDQKRRGLGLSGGAFWRPTTVPWLKFEHHWSSRSWIPLSPLMQKKILSEEGETTSFKQVLSFLVRNTRIQWLMWTVNNPIFKNVRKIRHGRNSLCLPRLSFLLSFLLSIWDSDRSPNNHNHSHQESPEGDKSIFTAQSLLWWFLSALMTN